MSRYNPCQAFDGLSDNEIVKEMLSNDAAFDCVYLKHKEYCVNFLKKQGADINDALDIYQESLIILFEKAKSSTLVLTCQLKVYITAICRNQFRSKLKTPHSKKTQHPGEFDDSTKDWFEEENDISNERINLILQELDKMQKNGDKCYERLRLFYYEKLSNAEIAEIQGLTNADNAKNQIGRCRDKLRKILGI